MKRTVYRIPDGCALCEDGRLAEYLDLREETQSGDIVLARVDRIMRGMDCAFADIGRRKDGFLPLKENSSSFTDKPVCSGDRFAVQIRREETGEKGAFLSRDLTIPGKAVILMPKNRYIGVSSRITDETTRAGLLETGKRIADGRYGLVMRTASEHMPEEAIRAETEELAGIWEKIREAGKNARNPGEILYASDPAAQLIRDYDIPETDIIRADAMPADLMKQLAASAERKVRLPGGGNIVIDRCEAMTVIDVNSASSALPQDKETTVTETNLEACEEAAIRIRLLDIAGIILIDFIDMEKEENRNRVAERLKEVFGRDRRKTVVHGWTKLGIMEMTRKRI